MNKHLKNLDLYFSSDCNLNCKYCYIYKNKEILQKYNEEILNNISNKKYANNVIDKFKNYKNDIESIGLWGAEPTLNSFKAKELLTDLFNYFINIKKLFFSTNGVIGIDGIKPYIDFISNYNKLNNRNIKLEIQFSIDGDANITNNNRGEQVYYYVMSSIKKTIEYCANKEDCCIINIKVKPTLTMDNIKYLIQDDSKLINWYLTFDNLYEQNKQYESNKLNLNLLGYPTLVNPDIYTVEDGKIFSSFVEKISNLKEEYFINYKHPLILQPLSCFKKDFFNKSLNISGFGACSAGRGSCSVDKDGNIHSCHRFFNYMPLPQEGLEPLNNYYNIKTESQRDKMDMANAVYHNNFYSRFEFFTIIAQALAKYGFIDKIYLDNKNNLLILFCLTESLMCHFGQAEETKDLFIAQTGYIKLFGNGAAQNLMKYIRRYGL